MFILNIYDEKKSPYLKCSFQSWLESNPIYHYTYNINQLFFLSLIDKITKHTDENDNKYILYNFSKNNFSKLNNKFFLFLKYLLEKIDGKIYIESFDENYKNNDNNLLIEKKIRFFYHLLIREREFKNLFSQKFSSIRKDNSIDFQNLANNWRGITVIPDIHGEKNSFEDAVKWALSNTNFIIFLGDLLKDIQDNKKNIFCHENISIIKFVYDIVIRGEQGLLCLGNHDIIALKNFIKYVYNNDISKTYDKEELDLETRKAEIILKFIHLIIRSKPYYTIDFIDKNKFIFSHASFFGENLEEYKDDIFLKRIQNSNIIYGNYIVVDNMFKDDLSWVNTIKKGQTCFVGHTVTNFFNPTRIENENGGIVYLLDTGCGKNGTLTLADLSIDGEIIKLRNYKKIYNKKEENHHGNFF